jgi:CheY-like chemotaxis protein
VPGVRVLVIDDSRDAAHLVSVLVQHFGHETKVVTVTKVAVDVARDWQPEFVFMDLAMPEIDGYEMARQLRENAGLDRARIFALSGHTENADRQKIAGIDGHVLKPISMVQIRSLLGDAR